MSDIHKVYILKNGLVINHILSTNIYKIKVSVTIRIGTGNETSQENSFCSSLLNLMKYFPSDVYPDIFENKQELSASLTISDNWKCIGEHGYSLEGYVKYQDYIIDILLVIINIFLQIQVISKT